VESLLAAVENASLAKAPRQPMIENGISSKNSARDRRSFTALLRRCHSVVLSLAFAGLLIACWELVIWLVPKWNFFLPPPSAWVPRLAGRVHSGEMLPHFVTTFKECTFGLVLGFVTGTIAAYAAAQLDSLSRAVRPLLIGMTAVPLFVLAPAFIVWFGIDVRMKVALAACSSCPFVALTVLDAVQVSRGTYHQYLHRNGVPNPQLFLHYTLPYTMASWFVGLRAAGVAALLGAFLGEFVSAERGLGYIILLDAGRYRMADALGGVALLFLLAVGLDLFFRFLASFRHRLLFKLRL
jgi:NitT/TauT family transport system permease protein